MKRSGGFTLIELLMSIAIIAILAAIVFAAVSSTKGNGNDAKTKYLMNGLRTAAQNYNTANGDFGVSGSCSSGMFTDTDLGMDRYTDESNYPSGTHLKCTASRANYAVSANLSDGRFWCVDSMGSPKALLTDPGNVVVCP